MLGNQVGSGPLRLCRSSRRGFCLPEWGIAKTKAAGLWQTPVLRPMFEKLGRAWTKVVAGARGTLGMLLLPSSCRALWEWTGLAGRDGEEEDGQ